MAMTSKQFGWFIVGFDLVVWGSVMGLIYYVAGPVAGASDFCQRMTVANLVTVIANMVGMIVTRVCG